MSDKYLLAGGIPFGVKSEGLDLNNNRFICSIETLSDFSLLSSYSTNGHPVLCAGNKNPRDCFVLEQSGSWMKKSNVLSVPRQYSKSVSLNPSTWWITGGEGPLMTTEILFDSMLTIPGPNLPHAVKNHCHVKLNQSDIFLIGGQISGNEQYTKKTWTFTWNSKTWTPRANLNEERGAHACGLYQGSIVIASGGYYGPWKTRTSVELMKIEDSVWTWTMGPALEKQTHSHSMVQDDYGDIYIIGGSNGIHYDSIYKFSPEGWIKQGKLKSKRFTAGILRLPEYFVNKLCTYGPKGLLFN